MDYGPAEGPVPASASCVLLCGAAVVSKSTALGAWLFLARFAADGEQALDYLYDRGNFARRAREIPTVLLLDLKLPKVDGLEVLKETKADETTEDDSGVVLTSSGGAKERVANNKLGVNVYVVKRLNSHELVNAIKEVGVFWAAVNEPPPGSVRKR